MGGPPLVSPFSGPPTQFAIPQASAGLLEGLTHDGAQAIQHSLLQSVPVAVVRSVAQGFTWTPGRWQELCSAVAFVLVVKSHFA